MNADAEQSRWRTALRLGSTTLLGVSVVLLVWAGGLALWSRLVAARGITDNLPRSVTDVHPWNEANLPGSMAIAVCSVVAVLLAAMVFTYWRGRTRGSAQWLLVGMLAILAVLFFVAFSPGIPAFYRMVMGDDPVSRSIPAAVAAWALAASGAIAAASTLVAIPSFSRRAVPLLALGAVVAVVASAAVTAKAVDAGDDSRYVDATTAAPVEVPAPPTAIGERRFTVAIPGALGQDFQPQYEIDAAGAGFIVRHAGTVTAYGRDGEERWHYRRTGPGTASVRGMRIYDEGRTVVIAYGGRYTQRDGLVGLDAVTGEQLWARQDADLSEAFGSESGLYDPDPYLVYRGEQTWTRFDSRTGHPMWSIPNPVGDCGERPVDTASRLVSLASCVRGASMDSRVLVLDPRTGEKLWEHTILSEPLPGEDDTVWGYSVVHPFPANNDGVFVEVNSRDRNPANDFYVNATSEVALPLPANAKPQSTGGPGGDFLTYEWRPEPKGILLSLHGPDGAQRCTVSDAVHPARSNVPGRRQEDVGYLSLRDSFVLYDWGVGANQSRLRVFSNTTCQETSRAPFDAFVGLVAAPGVVLALRNDRKDVRTVVVEGYF